MYNRQDTPCRELSWLGSGAIIFQNGYHPWTVSVTRLFYSQSILYIKNSQDDIDFYQTLPKRFPTVALICIVVSECSVT